LLTKENDGFGAYGWIIRYLRGWAITKRKKFEQSFKIEKKKKKKKKIVQGQTAKKIFTQRQKKFVHNCGRNNRARVQLPNPP